MAGDTGSHLEPAQSFPYVTLFEQASHNDIVGAFEDGSAHGRGVDRLRLDVARNSGLGSKHVHGGAPHRRARRVPTGRSSRR